MEEPIRAPLACATLRDPDALSSRSDQRRKAADVRPGVVL